MKKECRGEEDGLRSLKTALKKAKKNKHGFPLEMRYMSSREVVVVARRHLVGGCVLGDVKRSLKN